MINIWIAGYILKYSPNISGIVNISIIILFAFLWLWIWYYFVSLFCPKFIYIFFLPPFAVITDRGLEFSLCNIISWWHVYSSIVDNIFYFHIWGLLDSEWFSVTRFSLVYRPALPWLLNMLKSFTSALGYNTFYLLTF